MRIIDILIGVSWIAFWLYWLAASAGVKAGQTRWGRFAGVRLLVVVTVLAVARLSGLRGFGLTREPWLAGLGLAVFVLGLGLAVWARVYLGRNWGMPMTRKDDPELVTTGPYRLIRHPIYTGIITAMIGTTLAVGGYWPVAAVVLAGYFVYSAVQEERYLAERFGDSFAAYRRSSKMLIPFVFLHGQDGHRVGGRLGGAAGGLDGDADPVTGLERGGQHGTGLAGVGQQAGRAGLQGAGRAHDPQLVDALRGQGGHPGGGDDGLVLGPRDDRGEGAARGGVHGHGAGVTGAEHAADGGAGRRRMVAGLGDHAEGQARGGAGGHGRGEQPHPAARDAVQPDHHRRQLPGAVGGRHDLVSHRGGRLGGAGQAEPGRGLPEAPYFRVARRAVLEMTFEAVPLGPAESVQRVTAREQVHVVTLGLHHSTSRQSRIRIMPSRIRVLTVPRAAPSNCATSG
jgi:protein-S-isoprenylcysteine O-methyltransferase Ste14